MKYYTYLEIFQQSNETNRNIWSLFGINHNCLIKDMGKKMTFIHVFECDWLILNTALLEKDVHNKATSVF